MPGVVFASVDGLWPGSICCMRDGCRSSLEWKLFGKQVMTCCMTELSVAWYRGAERVTGSPAFLLDGHGKLICCMGFNLLNNNPTCAAC